MNYNIDDYLQSSPITSLYVKYNSNMLLDYLLFQDESNTIQCKIQANRMHNTLMHYWQVEIKDYANPINITTNNITLDAIRRLQAHEKKLKYINYDIATDKNQSVYTYTLTKMKGKEISLVLDKTYTCMVEDNEYCTILKVRNEKTHKFEETHYIDDTIYIIRNHIDNSESVYIKDSNMKYEFSESDLSVSEYLQYHKPFRVTDYTSNKQYRLEYDDYGITKSMIDISKPNIELCKYTIDHPMGKDIIEVQSIHPDIYNAFDSHRLEPDFIHSNILALETYNSFYPIGITSYKYNTYNKLK